MPFIPFTTPTSLLDAVNACLRQIGEANIDDLLPDNGADADAESAYQTVQEINRAVQLEGWTFNTEYPTLNPDVNGFLIVPGNALQIDTYGQYEYMDLVQRGNRLYDRVNTTYVFLTPVQVELKLLLDFETIPEAARNYITIRAARKFGDTSIVSETAHKLTDEDEKFARMLLEQMDNQNEDSNLATAGPFLNFNRGRTLRRF